MKPQLTVYKASAGSGKTFTLAREYMTLVIDNPQAYRTILAVTFTNKATEEMKLRILSQLYGLAHHLPESHDYLEQIHQALPHLSEAQIAENAGKALHLLIHNYNYFRVETIDTFFQSVLRNLARELDLTANLRIGLNDYQVEQQAVDELIESLDDTDTLLFWILDYIKDNIADDKSWNVIGQIKDFGTNIFKDFYKDNANRLEECMNQPGFFEQYSRKLRDLDNRATEQLQEIAATFFDTLEENGLTMNDFSGGKNSIWSYFNKLRNGKVTDKDLINATFQKCYDSPEAWVRKGDRKPGVPVFDCITSTLFRLLRFSEENRPTLVRLSLSARLTRKHLNQLRLLSSIDRKVREMNQEANRFLLSDTQNLLHSLIQDSDSPFVFEKIGTQLEHVMIDEFQDTSTVQWKNFKVLLEETMSRQDAGNLIVGDVKQSIYRWRSGDWRLLNNIEKEFNETEKAIEIETLDTNYRSDRNIIDFNNAFFTAAARHECDALREDNPQEALQLTNAYADVTQKVPAKKPKQGYVNIHLMSAASEHEDMLEQTFLTVQQLVESGVPYHQIAILVRSNITIQEIAEYIMDHSDYKLVSDEAFRLEASQAVMTLVTALHYLQHPKDQIARATLQKYAQLCTGSRELVQQIDAERETLLQKPLFELTETLYHLLHLGESPEMTAQSAYICAFYDQMNKFLTDNSSDIEAFLNEWDTNLHTKSIHSDEVDGIRLLTIHKSKGLEFGHVIMPACDWRMEKNYTIWCEPQQEPFNQLPLVPVDFSAALTDTIYAADYQHEHLQNMVDNLNLLYVGFTRASHGLYVIGKRGNVSTRSATIEACLPLVEKELSYNGLSLTLEGCETKATEGDVFFEYGEKPQPEAEKQKKASTNVFTQPSESIAVQIAVEPGLPEFKQSNKSRDFIEGDEEEEQQKYYIKMGTVLHNLFSTIHTLDDVDNALKQMELDGVLYDENVSRQKVEDMIRKRLQTPTVSHWFSHQWTVLNECTILDVEDGKVKEHRPDRVMKSADEIIVVDFKFGKPKAEHTAQVQRYMHLLSQMETRPVKGYLWYVYPNRIVEVEPSQTTNK